MLSKIVSLLGSPKRGSHLLELPHASKLPQESGGLEEAELEASFLEKCPNLDEDGVSLLFAMLKLEPSERISAEEALKHPYFNDLDESAFLG